MEWSSCISNIDKILKNRLLQKQYKNIFNEVPDSQGYVMIFKFENEHVKHKKKANLPW